MKAQGLLWYQKERSKLASGPKGTLKACLGTKRNAQGLLWEQKERSRLALGAKGTLKAYFGKCGSHSVVEIGRCAGPVSKGRPSTPPKGCFPVRIAPPPARALRASRAPGAARLSPQARDRACTCRNSLRRRGPPAGPGTAAAQPRTRHDPCGGRGRNKG